MYRFVKNKEILGGIGFMISSQLILGAKKWFQMAAISLLVVAVIYVLFAILLRVPLPEGIFSIYFS